MRFSMNTFLGVVILAALAACSGYSLTGGPGQTIPKPAQGRIDKGAELLSLSTVVVAPVRAASNSRIGESTLQILHKSTQQAAKRHLHFEIIDTDGTPFSGTSTVQADTAAKSMAVRNGADAYLTTTIKEYQERRGSRLAAEEGAAVSFSMMLFGVDSAEPIWQGTYVFRDEALSDNLLRIGERMQEVKKDGRKGWWTATQLFDRGVNDLMASLRLEHSRLFTR